MKMEKLVRLTAVLVEIGAVSIAISGGAYAQEPAEHRRIGISASLQASQLELSIPVWVGQRVVVAPCLSAVYAEDVGTDIGVGVTERFNLRDGSAIPYLGGRVVALTLSPKDGDSVTDWVFGLTLGCECFLATHFSLSTEAQVNFSVSDEQSSRFGNPGKTNMNTATAVAATAYF